MKRKSDAGGDLSGFLDKGTEFHGDVTFQDTLSIYGKFEGTIRSPGLLVVGESAEVNAQIENIGARRLYTICEKVIDESAATATRRHMPRCRAPQSRAEMPIVCHPDILLF